MTATVAAEARTRHGNVAIIALWAATVLGAAGMVVIVARLLADLGEGPALALLFCVLAADAAAFATIAVLIERNRPGNRVAWVLATAGALIVLTFSGFGVGALRYVANGSDDAIGGWFAVIGASALGPALYTAVPMLAVLFPDGRLPGPRWRVPFALATGAIVVSSVVGAVQPGPVNTDLPDNPMGIESEVVVALAALGGPLLPLAILAGAVLAVAAVAARFRRSAGIERQQVKWLLGAVTAIAILMPPSFVDGNGDSGFTPLDALAMGSLALLPIAVGIAITRHRLYEIDRLISRTIGWAVVTAMLVAVFAGAIVGLQALATPFTNNDTLAVAASTLVAAALFQPLRGRVQRAVDRRFNRSRVDAQRAIDAFGVHLRDEVDLDSLRRRLAATTGETVQPDGVAVWIRSQAGPAR